MATSSAGDNGDSDVDVDAAMQESTEIDRTVPEPDVKPRRGPMNLPPLPQFNLKPSPTSMKDVVERDKQKLGFFMDPMMKEMEEHVARNNELLDNLNKKMDDERKERIKARQTAHIPDHLKGSGQEMQTIMKTVEDLILMGEVESEDEEEEEEEEEEEAGDEEGEEAVEQAEGDEEKEEEPSVARLQKLDIHGHAALTAHSLAAYVSTLEEEHLKKFTAKITSDCQLWLSRLFRFEEASVVYHEEKKDGLAKVCRLALYQKYPKYPTEGFEALYSRPPVIYVSAASLPGLSNYLCLQLGLPMSCICTVPCISSPEVNHRMDEGMLESLIQDDVAAAKTPVLLVAFAGSPHLGHVDHLDKLQEICKRNNIWLHVEGNSLATLNLVSVPDNISPARSGDSMTISLGQWLGIPGIPFATLYKTSDLALVHAAGLNTFNPHLKLNCLPIWTTLQSLGHDGIVERIKHSCNMAEKLFEALQKISCIKQIGQEKKDDHQPIKSFGELISTAITALLVFEMVTPTIVFRFYDEDEETSEIWQVSKLQALVPDVAPYSGMQVEEEDDEQKQRDFMYYNALNTWLGETLIAANPNLNIHLIDVEKEGICIRFSPLETAQVRDTKDTDIDAFLESLKSQVEILSATILRREQFKAVVEAQDNLVVIDMPNWAGLGVVQYIPQQWKDNVDSLPEKAKRDINNINVELVHRLKSTDTAFSQGNTSNDVGCVKFGLITGETDIEELIGLVYTLGKEIEESSKYYEQLSEKIREGIEKANEELKKETEEKLIQEGVLRQVPVVGSLLNWWSPPPKDAMKGRTFNLTSGTVASTEKTYKYHMQIQEDSSKNQNIPFPEKRHITSFKESLKPVKSDTKTAGDIKANLTKQVNSPHSPKDAGPTDIPSSPGSSVPQSPNGAITSNSLPAVNTALATNTAHQKPEHCDPDLK